MGFHVFFILLFVMVTKHMCLGSENMTVCSEQERLALVKFRQSMKYDFGMLSSWVGEECCQWKGVHCDDATGSIVGLVLRGHNVWNLQYFPQLNIGYDELVDAENNYSVGEDYYLVGEDSYLVADEIKPSLAELMHLKYLDLSGNDFLENHIPEFIGSLKNLCYLNLSNAGFSGHIPTHIGNLSKLEVLDLGAPIQDLIADDMAWVLGLSSLKHLRLNGVDLKRAQNINMVLYMIPSLIELSLSHCSLTNAHMGPHLNLSSTIPNIHYVDLSKNFFQDPPPPFLHNMTSLEFLDLSNSYSNLSWKLSKFLNLIPTLSELHLSGCGLLNEHLSATHLNTTAYSNIEHLDLSNNLIGGRFPYILKNMSCIRVLDLQSNILISLVPVMPSLLKLDISSNNFTNIEHVGLWRQCHLKELRASNNYLQKEIVGPLTNISECSQYGLEVLHLDHNQINGSIPKSFVRLTNLRVLDLSSNKLTNQIPEIFGRLRMLQKLDFSSNKLNGMIPASIGQLGNINFLNVARNNIEGTIFQAHLANLSRLKFLDISFNDELDLNVSSKWIPTFQLRSFRLSSCKITGAFPQWLQTQKNIKMLVMSNNRLTGPLPSWLANMSIIPHLDLSNNNISGPLTNLPLMHPHFNGFRDEYKGSLLLRNNVFNESIPMSLCRRTALEILDLSGNMLSGGIPTCIDNLQKLRLMKLDNNELSGVIPSSIGRNSLLSWLTLSGNNFTGELPQDLRNLDHLWILDLGNNKISGKIPKWISELPKLSILILNKNKFSGRIPLSLCKNSCLHLVDVSANNLEGHIPHCVGELSGMIGLDYCRNSPYSPSQEKIIQSLYTEAYISKNTKLLGFTVMDLSSNKLVGEIPKVLTTLSLLALNLSHNHLSDSIPNNIGNMKNLVALDLSDNKLTGIIPPSMGQLNYLDILNLSHNSLSGPIPKGKQMNTMDSSSFADNKDLCGSPLPNICTNHDPTTITSKNKLDASDDPNKLWFYLVIASGFATGFLGVTGVLLFNRQWRRKFYMFVELTIDKIYVVVAIRVSKMKRSREDA